MTFLRRYRLALLGLAALVLVGAVLAVLAPRQDGRPDGEQAILRDAPATSTCADTLFVGVDGAGERPSSTRMFGPTVQLVRNRFVRDATAAGRRVQAVRIPYASRGPRALVGNARSGERAARVVTAARTREWREGIGTAIGATENRLRSLAATCPDQHVVLAGYAQGAEVLHRVLVRIDDEPALVGRVVGALLVADPTRVADTAAYLRGRPAAARSRAGATTLRLKPTHDVPRPGARYRVWSVCTSGDVACDLRWNTVGEALDRHAGYRHGGRSAETLRNVTGRAAYRLSQWPVPAPAETVVEAREDTAVSVQLDVRVADGSRDGVVWEDVTGLPTGMTLSPTGLLSGTPPRAGTHNIAYRVRGTRPPSTAYPGLVVVTVQPGTRALAAGGQDTCESRSDGSLRCWGVNNYGQIGDGTTTRRVNPTPVSGGGRWADVDTSGATSCGVRTDGTLWCWGLNNRGQLGLGDNTTRRTPTRVGYSTQWRSVGVGWWHACATRRGGALFCWGLNDRGQLGLMDQKNRRTPQRVGSATDWTEVVAAGRHTCGLRSGQAFCWGLNAHGELGNAERKIRIQPWPVSTGYRFTDLDTSWSHTCGVSRSGAPLCWGQNVSGQVGDGTRADRWTPVVPAVGDRLFTSVGTGALHSCAVDNAGAPWCWGDNSYGQLGAGDRVSRLSPGRVATSVQWFALEGGFGHTCGTTSAGVRCWGQNEQGQLGTGGTAGRLAPPS